jgi:hypothetical protein
MTGFTRREFIAAASAGLTLLAIDKRLLAAEAVSGTTAGGTGMSEKPSFFHVTEADGR